MPSAQAKLLSLLALVAYATAAVLAIAARRSRRKPPAWVGLVLLAAGAGLCLATTALRLARGHLPASSGLDAFVFLALLAGGATAYLKAIDAVPSAEVVLLPAAALCCLLAVALSGAAYRDFARNVWTVAHVLSAIAAAVAFAAAAGAGWLYLRLHQRLRRKDPAVLKWRAPSLERLHRFIRHVLPVAFALLTVTILTGLTGALLPRGQHYLRNWWTHPKVLTAVITWLLYALALHAAHGKRFRIRTAAILSGVGFLLLIALLVASTLMPGP